jgi:hypothetical protein
MLDKIKSGLNFTIIIVFIIALIYFIVISIINAFLPPKGSEVTKISQENVNIYMVEDNVVHDYTIFFNVEKIIQNTIYNLNKKEYEKVYSTLSSDAQKNINKSYFMSNIEKYNNNNFKYDINDEQNISGYRNTNNLKMLYRINQNEFLAVVTSTNSLGEAKIGIKLIDNSNYVITYLEL